MVTTTACLILGALLSVRGSPTLDQSGFSDVVIAIHNDIPEEDGPALLQSIKELMIETSDMMYFSSMTRFYIKEVTILTPSHWDLPEIIGEARKGEIFDTAAIQIARKDSQHGEAPYTHQSGGCGEEGSPILISDEYLRKLLDEPSDMVLKYGPLGNQLTHEFTKYRYGFFEEYGYPSHPGNTTDGEHFPSLYTNAFYDLEQGKWKMALLENFCSESGKLKGTYKRVEGEKEDAQAETLSDEDFFIDEETGEIITPDAAYFVPSIDNADFASMGSASYTSSVAVFCDNEYFTHNHGPHNKQNIKCLDPTRDYEPMSTWDTILGHKDFEHGHNDGIYVESTEPTFNVYKEAGAKFVLVLDNSGSMTSCSRMINLKSTLKRWVDGLKIDTKVAIVKFSSGNACITGSMQLDKDCYVTVSDVHQKDELKRVIDGMVAGGSTQIAAALKSAQLIMIEDHDAHDGQPGVVMLVTDGISGDDVTDQAVWKPFQNKRIPVITLNLGAEIDTRMETLVTNTKGRAFVSPNCEVVDNDAFQYATQTFIPGNVGDKAIGQQVTQTVTIPGLYSMKCADSNDGKSCFNTSFTIEKSLNKDVNIEALLFKQGASITANEVVDKIAVMKRDDIQSEVAGFEAEFSAEYPNFVDFGFSGYVPEEHTEQLLDVYLTLNLPNTPMEFGRTTAQLTFKGKRNFAGDEDADYWVSCDHPSIMEPDKPFLIKSQVMRGTTPVNYANVVAKVTVSRASDPDGEILPRFFTLKDDGSEGTNSGDETKNDGTYSTIVSPTDLQADDGFGISVMCNLLESSEGEWNDNNFYGRKKSLPTQNTFTPYCCGTKDQKWNIPRSKDVTKLLRSSIATGAFLDPSIFVKGTDFGPPAKIADLKAEIVGQSEDGLVKLSWTATGDDWGSGTAQSYNLVYSDERKGLMSSNKVTKDSKTVFSGSLEPVPAGQKMQVILKLENHHVPGTYMFALNATDDAGKVSRPSNIARVNFHDGSPLVMHVDPHLVHGHAKNDLPFEEKIRRIVKDERIVKRFMAHIEKNKKIVRDAENNVMERKLKEKMGRKGTSVDRIMEKIKNDDVLREMYKKKLL